MPTAHLPYHLPPSQASSPPPLLFARPLKSRLLSERAPFDRDRRADGSVAVRTSQEEEAFISGKTKRRKKRGKDLRTMPGKQQQQQQDEQDLQQLKQLIPGLNGGGGANVSQVRREEMSTIRGILQKLASKISEILAPPGVWRNRRWIHMNLGSKLVKDPKNITKCTVKFVLKSQAMSTELQERMGPNLRELAPAARTRDHAT